MEGLTELEHALAETSPDPSRGAEVRRLLVESELHVLGEEVGMAAAGRLDDGKRELRLVHHTFQGTTYLSAYTSLRRVEAVAPGEPYLVLRGGAVFGAVEPGVQLVVNLGSWPNRSFDHQEAAELAALWERSRAPAPAAPAAADVRQPERYPAPVLEALWAHFGGSEAVVEAYLAQVFEAGHPSHLLVAFRTRHPAGAGQATAEAGRVVAAVHDVEVRLHELGSDELSRRVVEAGVCFFERSQPASDAAGLVS
jgi:hypothetical protein